MATIRDPSNPANRIEILNDEFLSASEGHPSVDDNVDDGGPVEDGEEIAFGIIDPIEEVYDDILYEFDTTGEAEIVVKHLYARGRIELLVKWKSGDDSWEPYQYSARTTRWQ
ncbi:MAG: hypothetical protein ACREOZ_02265 [Gloeomargaritales cyanobacterium]